MEARVIRCVRIASCAVLALWSWSVPASAAPAPAVPVYADELATIERRMATDPERALVMAQQARASLPDGAERGRREATLLWLQGEAQVRIGDPHRGLQSLREAGVVAASAHAPLRLMANILLSQGSGLTDVGRITEALNTLQRAHDMFVRLGDQRSRARALILIALLYVSGHDNETALRYFDQARENYGSDPGLAVAVDSGRGTALLALGRTAEAEAEFRGALAAARTLRSAPAIAQSLGYMAEAQLRGGDVAVASHSIARAFAAASRAEAAPTRPQLVALAAAAALQQGEIAKAVRLVRERFDGVTLDRTMLADRYAHDTAYRVYVAAGRPAEALRHLIALKRLDDQATEIARSTSAALAAAQFDYANQELRIARLKTAALSRRMAFERATAHTQRLMFYGVIGTTLLVITLLAVGLAMIGRSRNRVRAVNQDLAASNAQLEKLSRAKTEFLATTSHEIRTPLNGILGMTQVMLADGGLDALTRDRLGVVHGAGVTMRALVNDILDMAKIETGRMTVESVPFDLHATVEEAARLWREPAAAKGLVFDVAIGAVPRWIMGDPARLRQIVFNLLSNAVKFTAAGSVSLLVAEEEGRLRLAVADSGIGIDTAAHGIIFDSFRQAEAGTTRRFGGTGLGLSISRSLAQGMGGDVTVTSRVGTGSCFTLDLPCVVAEAPGEKGVHGGLLVVERNPINRAMFRSLFAGTGVVSFADADALAEIARTRPDRVLVDAATLELTGGVLSELVDAANGAPVALLTTVLDEETRCAIYAAGITRIVEKPVSKRVLVAAIAAMPDGAVRDAA